MKKGLIVVIEGQRINLRVYRRLFYPIQKEIDGENYIIYSDTGREREINYRRPEDYNLEDPFSRIRLVRLARALNSLKCSEPGDNIRECRVTICNSKELYDPEAEDKSWVPFDPDKLDSLSDRIKKLKKKVKWSNRMNK